MRLTLLTLWFLCGFSVFAADDSVDRPVFAQSAFDQIQQLEEEFKDFQSTLLVDGYNTEGFYKNIVEPMNAGSELNLEYLQEWEIRNSKLRTDRFKIWEKKEFYIVALVHAGVHQAALTLPNISLANIADNSRGDDLRSNAALSAENVRLKFKADLVKLDDLFEKWEALSHIPQENITPKDQQARLYGFYYYLKKAREMMQSLGKAPQIESLPTPRTAFQGKVHAGGSLGYLFGQLALRNTGRVLNYANPLQYILPREWQRNLEKPLVRNHTPFNNNGGISGLFKGLEEIRGYQVKITGQENLTDIPLKGIAGYKVVNLFLPSHRHDMADAVLMSRISDTIGSFLMFANPSAFAGNYVFGQMLASIPEFISVGKWRGYPDLSPTEKLLRNLEQERSPNVINYPQGFLASMGEILPINANFVQKLLLPLIEAGYDVNVIPISYEVDSKFMSKTAAVDDVQLKAHFHAPLRPATVKALVNNQIAAQATEGDSPKTKYFDHFLAGLWLENIKDHGELSIEEILSRTQSRLGINSALD